MLVSCTKTETTSSLNCDNAELRIFNSGVDTILYAFGAPECCNKLAPHDSASYFFGSLQNTTEDLHTWQIDVYTPQRKYLVEMNSCVQILDIHAP